MDNITFSLDIGTRKIAAFLTRQQNNGIEIVDTVINVHKNRAVRAGQIQDIEEVSRLVNDVKRYLEKNNNIELKKVSTAIAGRNLKCFRSEGYLKFENTREITNDDIRQAELSAIHSVISGMEESIEEYYFAGYTVIRYEIDNETIFQPAGHYAQGLKAELIATFLPRKVLESLFSVTRNIGLEISYLTLEPIAAAEAVLPANMRFIPIVLIDIGAGTSDIAVISKGSIQSFGMIPFAGDFITEGICTRLLVDFNEGERIKKDISSHSNTVDNNMNCYVDIFGKEQKIPANEMIEAILPFVKELAQKIAEEIKKLGFFYNENGSAADFAVVLVGGGSLTPKLNGELASALGIARERIGIRTPYMTNKYNYNMQLPGSNMQASNDSNTIAVLGPQTAVALGLASLSAQTQQISLIHITVNDKKVELINFQDSKLDVMSALMQTGISKQKIYGKPGLAISFTLNGELKTIKGHYPKPSQVFINNQTIELNTQLKEGDKITFIPAIDGENPAVNVSGILPDNQEVVLLINNIEKKINLPFDILINDNPANKDTNINDRDNVRIQTNHSFTSLLLSSGISMENFLENKITIDVMGQRIEKIERNHRLIYNGTPIENIDAIYSISVNPGDVIELKTLKSQLTIKDFIETPAQGRELKVKINGEEFTFPGSLGKILLNGKNVEEDAIVSDGDIVRAISGRDAEAALVDIFKYISVDPKDTIGKRLKLFVNQEEANFTTPLSEGAEVRVGFE